MAPPLLGHPPRWDIFLSRFGRERFFFFGIFLCFYPVFVSSFHSPFVSLLSFSKWKHFRRRVLLGFVSFFLFLSSTTTTGHFEFHFQTNGIEPAESESHASEECKHLTNEMFVPFRMEKQNRLYRELKSRKKRNVCEFLQDSSATFLGTAAPER